LLVDFKAIKKSHKDGESTDDEEIEEELKKIYAKNKDVIDRRNGSVD